VSLWREDKPIAKAGTCSVTSGLDGSLKRVGLKPRRRGLWWLHVSAELVSVGSELYHAWRFFRAEKVLLGDCFRGLSS
jgi:hypothetical protein